MGLSEFLCEEYAVVKRKRVCKSELTAKYSGKSVLGVRVQMKNGLMAKCIAYRTPQDIDIEFDDGSVVRHRSKKNFLLGSIAHPSFYDNCEGKRVQMPCGMWATCVSDNGWDNIDVQFDDGVITRGRTRHEFRSGEIRHPSVYSVYVGQRVCLKDGRYCICIDYRSPKDVDVQLEDGTTMTGLAHSDLSGWTKVSIGQTVSIIGESHIMSCGLTAVCVADRGCNDVDIQFSDGVVVAHTTRGNFRKGAVTHPGIRRYDYPGHEDTKLLGARKQMNCGFWCTCIEYVSGRDITVQFDDGCIVAHRGSEQFRVGEILHPNLGRLCFGGDSIAQRLLYYYMRLYFTNVGYCAKPLSLRTTSGHGFEIDIFIPDIKVGIEFDGSVQHHFSEINQRRKIEAVENSNEIDRLFVVVERDKRIAVVHSPKTQHIYLTYRRPYERLPDVYEAAKIILSDLGKDTSSLKFDLNVVADLYMKGVSVCQNL